LPLSCVYVVASGRVGSVKIRDQGRFKKMISRAESRVVSKTDFE
jgi:hypothetical protein